MTYPGEVRYVDITGSGDWTVYVRDRRGVWYPADIGGPGYLTDNQIAKKEWTSDGR